MTNLTLHTAEMEHAYSVFRTAQVVICCMNAVIIVVETWGFVEYLCCSSKEINVSYHSQHNNRVLRWSLFGNGVFGTLAITFCTLVAFDHRGDFLLCDFYVRAMAACYVTSVLCNYRFMAQKTKLVGKYHVHTSKMYKFFANYSGPALAVLTPPTIIMAIALAEPAMTTAGGCYQMLYIWYTWLFVVGHNILCCMLTYLFLRPIYEMTIALADTPNQDLFQYRKLYRWTATINMFAICTSVVALSIYSAFRTVATTQHSQDHLVVEGLICMSVDTFVLMCCARLSTYRWIPARVLACFEIR